MTDLTEALTAEVAHRQRRHAVAKQEGRVLWAQIHFVKAEKGKAALASGDPGAMQASLDDLKGYGNDD